ncbi:type II secretion system F family protein [Sphingosinicella sp.]|uniref:type II secretion system F family protein n=1 Tax=Sphingosinicella sp. TaxID=1917971 RepID=UPI004037BD1C
MTPSTGPTVMGIDVIMAASVLSAIATFAVLVAIYAATTVRDPMAKRVKALNERREQLKAGIVASTNKRRKTISNRNEMADKVRGLLSSLKMLQDSQVQKAQAKLMQAGVRSKDMAFVVIFARFVLPVVLGIGAILLVYVIDYFPTWGAWKKYALVAGTLLLAYKAPDLWLKNKIDKRTHAIRKGLPDALDLLVICAEAGLTVDAAFGRVARELGKAYPELGDEFALTSIELGFLTDRRLAFENLAKRIDLDSVRGVVTTMIQTEKYGTPLASALRVLSAEFRNERMMRAEEKAARLPAIMTVPLILFILPVLFIVILGPAACSINDALLSGQ